MNELSNREMSIHCARVYLAESRRRRASKFGWVLLAWAANQRRKAMAERIPKQEVLL